MVALLLLRRDIVTFCEGENQIVGYVGISELFNLCK